MRFHSSQKYRKSYDLWATTAPINSKQSSLKPSHNSTGLSVIAYAFQVCPSTWHQLNIGRCVRIFDSFNENDSAFERHKACVRCYTSVCAAFAYVNTSEHFASIGIRPSPNNHTQSHMHVLAN